MAQQFFLKNKTHQVVSITLICYCLLLITACLFIIPSFHHGCCLMNLLCFKTVFTAGYQPSTNTCPAKEEEKQFS